MLVAWVVVGLHPRDGPTLRIAGHELPMPDRLLDRWAPGFAALATAAGSSSWRRSPRRARRPRHRALGRRAARRGVLAAGSSPRPRSPPRATQMDLGPLPADGAADRNRRCRRSIATSRGASPARVLELPVGVTLKEVPSAVVNTWYEYFSIFHWRPLVNGYASYWPPTLEVIMAMARGLPAPRALENLADVHGRALDRRAHGAHAAARARRVHGRRRRASGWSNASATTCSTRWTRAPAGRVRRQLRRRDAAATIEGTPLVELPPAARLAALESSSCRRSSGSRRVPRPSPSPCASATRDPRRGRRWRSTRRSSSASHMRGGTPQARPLPFAVAPLDAPPRGRPARRDDRRPRRGPAPAPRPATTVSRSSSARGCRGSSRLSGPGAAPIPVTVR